MPAPTMASTAMSALGRPAASRARMVVCTANKPSVRHYPGPSRTQIIREMERAARAGAKRATKEQSMSQMEKMANAEYFKGGGGPLFPGTFVSLPLPEMMNNPTQLASYLWYRVKGWSLGTLSVLRVKLESMPGWTKRPQWKAKRGKIAPTAKILYQEMLEAFAAGDKATVQRLCLPEFSKKLRAAIDRRNPNEQVRFELVKYNKTWAYPRLMSHQIHQVNPHDKSLMTEQAVVGIASTQQASRHDTSGKTIPGSLKIQEKIEYVVLSRQVSTKTFESEAWRIWGTTAATTVEAYQTEQAVIEREQAKRAGWEETKKQNASK